MTKFLKSLFKYILEFIVVAFGVFLGLYVSDLRSEEKLAEEKTRALQLIQDELQSNLNNIREAYLYHKSLEGVVDSIRQVIPQQEGRRLYIGNPYFQHNKLPGWSGFMLPDLDKTALESVKLSGTLQEFEIEKIRLITNMYTLMDRYDAFSDKILDKMIGMDSETKVVDIIIVLDVMTKDIRQYEGKVMMTLEKTLAGLKNEPEKKEGQ